MWLTADTADNSTCTDNATLRVRATGGQAPFSFFLRGGGFYQTSGDFDGLPAGEYLVIVEDARGCQIESFYHWVVKLNASQCESFGFIFPHNLH